MNREYTLKQICKMISSGEIPKKVYDKYLSKTQVGFMNEKDLINYLLDNVSLNDEAKDIMNYINNLEQQ